MKHSCFRVMRFSSAVGPRGCLLLPWFDTENEMGLSLEDEVKLHSGVLAYLSNHSAFATNHHRPHLQIIKPMITICSMTLRMLPVLQGKKLSLPVCRSQRLSTQLANHVVYDSNHIWPVKVLMRTLDGVVNGAVLDHMPVWFQKSQTSFVKAIASSLQLSDAQRLH